MSLEDAQAHNTSDLESDTNSVLMNWEIKAHPNWMVPIDAPLGFLTAIAVCACLWVHLAGVDASTRDFYQGPTIFGVLLTAFLWWSARKKTVFKYCISEQESFVECWDDYLKNTKYLFRGLAVTFALCVLSMLVIAPSLIWALVGPAGMAVIAAKKLMTWENEVTRQSFTWDRPQCVFTDRRRGLVVLERRYDPDIPFEENYLYVQIFLPRDRIDDFLALCKKYAPSDVEYKEGNFRE